MRRRTMRRVHPHTLTGVAVPISRFASSQSTIHPRAHAHGILGVGVRRPDQQGITLIMALLVLATVTGIALAIASLVVREVVQSKNLDNAIVAYYAADAGMEEALLKIKTNRLVTPEDPGLTQRAGFAATVADLDNDDNLPIGTAKYSLAAVEGPDVLLASIPKDDFAQVDLFSPDAPRVAEDVKRIGIFWEGENSTTWLELVIEQFIFAGNASFFYQVEPGSGEFVPSQRQNVLLPCDIGGDGSPSCANGWCTCDGSTTDISQQRDLRIQIKALYGNARNVRVVAYRFDAGVYIPVPLRNRIQVTSVGTLTSSNVAIRTSVPWRIPAGGLFAHVLFSEEDLVKN